MTGERRQVLLYTCLSNPRLRTPGVSPGVKASDAGKILNVGVVPQAPRA